MVGQTAAHAVLLVVPKAAVKYPRVWEADDADQEAEAAGGGGDGSEVGGADGPFVIHTCCNKLSRLLAATGTGREGHTTPHHHTRR